MRLQDFKVLSFDVVGTLIDFERGMLDYVRLVAPQASVSDEEFLLRYIMKGEDEIRAMREAGPPRKYLGADMPLLALIEELGKRKQVRYVQVRRGSDSLLVQNQG